jgi:hypothetical protein
VDYCTLTIALSDPVIVGTEFKWWKLGYIYMGRGHPRLRSRGEISTPCPMSEDRKNGGVDGVRLQNDNKAFYINELHTPSKT